MQSKVGEAIGQTEYRCQTAEKASVRQRKPATASDDAGALEPDSQAAIEFRTRETKVDMKAVKALEMACLNESVFRLIWPIFLRLEANSEFTI